jgi:hypothetical protein
LCIHAPTWAHPGDEVAIAGPGGAGGPVAALVVACREAQRGQLVAHVAFLAAASDAGLRSLLAGLSDEP